MDCICETKRLNGRFVTFRDPDCPRHRPASAELASSARARTAAAAETEYDQQTEEAQPCR